MTFSPATAQPTPAADLKQCLNCSLEGGPRNRIARPWDDLEAFCGHEPIFRKNPLKFDQGLCSEFVRAQCLWDSNTLSRQKLRGLTKAAIK
jgi:hypothetical protein